MINMVNSEYQFIFITSALLTTGEHNVSSAPFRAALHYLNMSMAI